jgi:hypothetical protein
VFLITPYSELLTFNFALLTVRAVPAVFSAVSAVRIRETDESIAVKRQQNPKTAAEGSRAFSPFGVPGVLAVQRPSVVGEDGILATQSLTHHSLLVTHHFLNCRRFHKKLFDGGGGS